MIASIILAAGASSRMGTPKALLDYRGETFLDRLIRVLGAVTAPVIAVLGYHAAEIRSGVRRQANFVVNPAPERGQLSSLQTGLAVLPPDALGFAFIPMDCPAVGEETVARLVQTFLARDSDTLLVIPRYDARTRPTRPSTLSGTSQRPVEAALLQERSVVRASSSKDDGYHRGHPVFAARAIADEILALPPGAQARDVIHRHVPRTQYLDVEDRGILADVDDPAAYRRLLETLP